MPWTRKQLKVAEAVKHGWKPKGSAKGFTLGFAGQVIQETDGGKRKSMIRKAVKGKR